jgi:hypothetical protein
VVTGRRTAERDSERFDLASDSCDPYMSVRHDGSAFAGVDTVDDVLLVGAADPRFVLKLTRPVVSAKLRLGTLELLSVGCHPLVRRRW